MGLRGLRPVENVIGGGIFIYNFLTTFLTLLCEKIRITHFEFCANEVNILLLVVCFLLGNSPASEFCMPTSFYTYVPMKMEQTVCSETSTYKIQTPGNYPEESIKHFGISSTDPFPLRFPNF